MLTGRELFKAETVSDILAAVLKEEPDWTRVPPKVRRLLQSCLRKDPKQRLQAIGDSRLLLDDAPSQPALAPRSSLWWKAATGVLTAAVVVVLWSLWPRAVDHPAIRLSVDLGPEAVWGDRVTAAISPDGTRIVFPARGADGKQQLAIRLLDQASAKLLAGAENGQDPPGFGCLHN